MNAVAKRENNEVRERSQEQAYVSPPVNIFETKDGYVLEADLPGVTREDLDVTLEGSTLTLVAHRPAPARDFGNPVYQECAELDYRRVFELDPNIDSSKIKARMEEGVLILELPKSEKVKPRRIKISE
ncbi:MAG TPA: Hsp20/alpha crystallin family protein [Verrucomicrobiae bacterium]|jgi:HSP20 family protein